MRADLLTIYVYLAGVVLALAFVLAIIVKVLARPLTFYQSLLVSLVAAATGIALYVAYVLSKPALGLADTHPADSLVSITIVFAMGAIITRLARRYGIEKTGWLGIGAKAMLGLIALGWILVGAGLLFVYLGRHG